MSAGVSQGSNLFQWDEGIQTMSLGEKSEIVIEAEWAYGRKGIEGKYPFHSVTHSGMQWRLNQ